jgi:hypothetical protein
MEMFWNFRRRPSRFATFMRSLLMVGAAVGVPVGLEVIRRMVRAGRTAGIGHAMNGRGATSASSSASRRGSRKRRAAAAMERT